MKVEPKEVVIYRTIDAGYGCIQEILKVDNKNFVSETETTITVKEEGTDALGCVDFFDQTYHKTLDGFIKNENEQFVKNIAELRERHEHTLKMANELRAT